MFQTLLVALILVACAAYTARRLWRRLHTPPSCDHCHVQCEGCPLAASCKHR